MTLEEPEPPETYMYVDWAQVELARRENAAEMEGVDGVDEMFARRALPAPSDNRSADE